MENLAVGLGFLRLWFLFGAGWWMYMPLPVVPAFVSKM